MRDCLKRLFCRHDWEKIAVFQDVDEAHNVRYAIRRYRCRKCGRITHRDGRRDSIAAKSRKKVAGNA